MTQVEKEVAAGKSQVVESFWTGVKSKGSPLVEPFADDRENSLVSFIWRGTAQTKNVF